jgi:hypothetical protein
VLRAGNPARQVANAVLEWAGRQRAPSAHLGQVRPQPLFSDPPHGVASATAEIDEEHSPLAPLQRLRLTSRTGETHEPHVELSPRDGDEIEGHQRMLRTAILRALSAKDAGSIGLDHHAVEGAAPLDETRVGAGRPDLRRLCRESRVVEGDGSTVRLAQLLRDGSHHPVGARARGIVVQLLGQVMGV